MLKSSPTKGVKIAGFRVTVEPLLPVVIIVIGWLLSERYFPTLTIGYLPYINYILGGAASLMLTFSILFHEFGHAFTAVKSNLSIERIHLYLFGGMAELKHRPLFPKQELFVALSGPFASFFLAGLFYLISVQLPSNSVLTRLVFDFLIQINVLLGVFNLIPIFPLDGGRALRAFFWMVTAKYHKASLFTLYVSYVVIAGIFLLGLVDYLHFNSGYEVIIVLLAIYLGYTVWSGRVELNHNPKFEDLIYHVELEPTASNIINQILSTNEQFLTRMVIPVLEDSKLKYVIRGNFLHNESVIKDIRVQQEVEGDLKHFYSEVFPGDYIDLTESSSFDPQIIYSTDFVPVVEDKHFIGLCDANELRFWLMEYMDSHPDSFDIAHIKEKT
jgi:Zn-dependent protease